MYIINIITHSFETQHKHTENNLALAQMTKQMTKHRPRCTEMEL